MALTLPSTQLPTPNMTQVFTQAEHKAPLVEEDDDVQVLDDDDDSDVQVL